MSSPAEPSAALDPETWELVLYVVSGSPKSARAVANLREACNTYLPDRHAITVVDLLEDPSRAEEDNIVAVPTLVRRRPTPARKVVGDLSDTESLLIGLELRPRDLPPPPITSGVG